MGEGGAYEGACPSKLDVDAQCLKVVSWGGLGSRGDKGQQATARRDSRRCPWTLGLVGTGGRRAPSTPVVCLTSYTGRFEKTFSFFQ